MKIVHYLSRVRLADGGVVRALLDLCDALGRAGHGVTLLPWEPADAPASWRADGGPVRVVEVDPPRGRMGRFTGAQLEAMRPALRGADALHLHVVWDPACMQLSRLARESGVATVFSTHGMLDDWSMAQRTLKKRVYLALGARAMLRGAGAVHCTAEAERSQSVKWHGNPRTRVVPLVFDVGEYETLPGEGPARRAFPMLDTGRPIVLFLSRLHEKKRPEMVAEAAACSRSGRGGGGRHRRGRGTGMRARVRGAAARAGIGDRVHLLGMVSGVEKVSLYEWASVFALPTSQENFGFVLIEALASGTPAVTTKGVDIWPELGESGGVEVVDPLTKEGFADAIVRVLGRGQEMGAKGRAWALGEFRGDAIATRYGALYEEACSA